MTRVEQLLEQHELVGIDAAGELCSCGAKDPAFVEHLADVLASAFGIARYWPVGTGSNSAPWERPRIGWRDAA